MLTRDAQDAKPNVEFPYGSPETLVRLLNYLYVRDYNDRDEGALDGFAYPLTAESEAGSTNSESEPSHDGEDNEPNGSESDNQTEPYHENGEDSEYVAFNNLDLLHAADRVGVAGLKEMAMKRFITWIENNIAHDQFLTVIQEAMLCPIPDKKPLTSAIGQVLSSNLKELVNVNVDEVVSTIAGYEFLASIILKALMDENALLHKRNDQLASELKEVSQEKKEREDDWATLSRCINSRSACRQCGETWGLRVDGYRFEYGTLRCRNCNTRHGPEHSLKHVDSFGYF